MIRGRIPKERWHERRDTIEEGREQCTGCSAPLFSFPFSHNGADRECSPITGRERRKKEKEKKKKKKKKKKKTEN